MEALTLKSPTSVGAAGLASIKHRIVALCHLYVLQERHIQEVRKKKLSQSEDGNAADDTAE